MHVGLEEAEKMLTFTDSETLEKYLEIKRRNQEEQRLKELYEEDSDLDYLFEEPQGKETK